jgi:hypothetical protein
MCDAVVEDERIRKCRSDGKQTREDVTRWK